MAFDAPRRAAAWVELCGMKVMDSRAKALSNTLAHVHKNKAAVYTVGTAS
jgi:hypothetical protein